jgi:asparagine synthase (glutamine-hydrolysing)
MSPYQRKRPPWSTLLDADGLRVIVPASGTSRPHSTDIRDGIILGDFFPLTTEQRAYSVVQSHSLTASQETELLKTSGRSLIKSHWGAYVLLLSNPNSATVTVLRGPMSSLACFWTDVGGVTLFFSRPEDVIEVLPVSFNWDHICAQSVQGDYLCEETGLRGVSTLLSGDCLVVRGEQRSRRTYWTPRAGSGREAVPDLQTAARLLGATTRAVTDCWCSSHESIIVSLSGGFDSSVILSCAAAAPNRPAVRAITFYSRGSADERPFARSAAHKAGVPLREMELPKDLDFRVLLGCARTASPVLNFTAFATEPAMRQFSEGLNASALLTGELGDCVLGHGFGPELLGDAFDRYGTSLRLMRVLLDYSLVYRISIWRAAGLAVEECRSNRRPGSLGLFQRNKDRGITLRSQLASDEAVANYERVRPRFIHPWFQDVRDGPPAWLNTVAAMITLTSTSCQAPLSGAIDRLLISPLASQPVIEAFLSIPADYHIAGSQNAAVSRRAFATLLSSEVLGRGTAKGTPEFWLRQIVAQNRPFLRELLLDGNLVKAGILDRHKVEDTLSGDLTAAKASVVDIITQLYIESWLSRWTGTTGQKRVPAPCLVV